MVDAISTSPYRAMCQVTHGVSNLSTAMTSSLHTLPRRLISNMLSSRVSHDRALTNSIDVLSSSHQLLAILGNHLGERLEKAIFAVAPDYQEEDSWVCVQYQAAKAHLVELLGTCLRLIFACPETASCREAAIRGVCHVVCQSTSGLCATVITDGGSQVSQT